MDLVEQTKTKMKAAIDHLINELKSIRTGRANPSMLDSVFVEIYGSKMAVKNAASVNAPEPRLLLVTPFDPQNTAAIGKAIGNANIGVTPIVDGNVVRCKIPHMDASAREAMIKLCHKRCEEAKVSIRNIRRDGNEAVRKQKADGNLAEDQMKKMEKSIQELTDKFCKEADDLSSKKEKEVSTI